MIVSWEDYAGLTMSALEPDGGLCGVDDQVAQELPRQGQVGSTTPLPDGHHEEPHCQEAEFELDGSWEDFVNARLDGQGAKELVETGQERLIPGMGMETDIWDDQEGSWEALADRTISILEMRDQSSCQAGTDVPEMEDEKMKKEDDLGQSKDDLGQDEDKETPPGAENGILHGTPTSGGSDDQDYHGQDNHQRVELGGTYVPERLVTSTPLEGGDVMDRQRSQLQQAGKGCPLISLYHMTKVLVKGA